MSVILRIHTFAVEKENRKRKECKYKKEKERQEKIESLLCERISSPRGILSGMAASDHVCNAGRSSPDVVQRPISSIRRLYGFNGKPVLMATPQRVGTQYTDHETRVLDLDES